MRLCALILSTQHPREAALQPSMAGPPIRMQIREGGRSGLGAVCQEDRVPALSKGEHLLGGGSG